jgi:uncharacterized protein (TIGR03382 family)
MRRFALAVCFAGLVLARTDAAILTLTSDMTGSQEVPPTGSPGTGHSVVTIDTIAQTLLVNLSFANLTAPAAASHIHCCVLPGVNAPVAVPFTGFPAATSGTYTHLFSLADFSTFNSAWTTANGLTTAAAAASFLETGLAAGLGYTNIHNANFPGGEIRGQLTPEPATMMLAGASLVLLALVRRRRAVSN